MANLSDSPQAALAGGSLESSSPGTVTLHRLNKVEYANSVRDLFAITPSPAGELTPDAAGDGFDNNADALQTTPADMDVLQRAASLIGQEVATPTSPAYAKVVACSLEGDHADDCLRASVRILAQRAWRRPPSDEEVQKLLAGAPPGSAAADRIGSAASLVVLSPYFMYRVELDDLASGGRARALNPYETATRLSYFLWSSIPDDALLQAAADGKLSSDEELLQQVSRMLADPKGEALVDDFFGQWFATRTAAQAAPDPQIFPTFSEKLRQSMLAESKMFFADLIAHNAPIGDLLTASTSFLNDDLADFYGVPKPNAKELTRAALGNHRLGALTQGSLLLATSPPTRESPVMRGKFILAQLLCSAPPPPPPGVPQLGDDGKVAVTDRGILERHVTNPACASCHNIIDPLGYAMMHFDGIGQWRDQDHGQAIDTSGTWPDGRAFADAADLAAQLAADPRFTRCAAQKMFSYALGRAYRDQDAAELGKLLGRKPSEVGLRDLINAVVLSPSFRARQGAPS